MKHRSKNDGDRARNRSGHWISHAMIVLGVFVVAVAVGLSTDRRPADSADDARPRSTTSPVGMNKARITPPVASRGPRARSAASGPLQLDSLRERPATIQHVDVERAAGRTRLTIESDARTRFQIERRDEARRVDITVDAATQEDPTAALDLVGTPIRSLRTRSIAHRTVLTLALDAPQRIRTRWTGELGEARLVIELEAIGDARSAEDGASQRASKRRAPTRDDGSQDSVVVRASRPHAWPAEAAARETVDTHSYSVEDGLEVDSPDESGDDLGKLVQEHVEDDARGWAQGRARGQRTQGVLEDPAEVRTDAPPAALVIERSAADRARTSREQTQRRAEESIRTAHIAHSGGDLARAVSDYMRALDIVPGHRRAIFEVSPLLVELGRLDDAIALVRAAREGAGGEAGLTMLHAQLVARQGDVAGAIKVLERGAASPADAPEIHALAAAYLQQTGEHALAIDRYETLLRHHPERSRWWMGLGISFEAAGRHTDALDVYRIAMQVGQLSAQSRRWVAARVQALSEEG